MIAVITTYLRRLRHPSRLGLAGLGVGFATLAGCSVGSYPVDFFTEMHYSPSIRRQEAPVMSAPGQAVAFQSAGGPVAQAIIQPPYDIMPLVELVAITENPVKDSPTVRERGVALFARNCSVCHGAEGDGTGIVSAFWSQDATPPADLTSIATRGKTDGTLFGIVTHGQGIVPVPDDAGNPEAWAALTNMPPFRKLLTPEERWMLVRHIRSLQQG